MKTLCKLFASLFFIILSITSSAQRLTNAEILRDTSQFYKLEAFEFKTPITYITFKIVVFEDVLTSNYEIALGLYYSGTNAFLDYEEIDHLITSFEYIVKNDFKADHQISLKVRTKQVEYIQNENTGGTSGTLLQLRDGVVRFSSKDLPKLIEALKISKVEFEKHIRK